MPKVEINGRVVEFATMPSADDIDHAAGVMKAAPGGVPAGSDVGQIPEGAPTTSTTTVDTAGAGPPALGGSPSFTPGMGGSVLGDIGGALGQVAGAAYYRGVERPAAQVNALAYKAGLPGVSSPEEFKAAHIRAGAPGAGNLPSTVPQGVLQTAAAALSPVEATYPPLYALGTATQALTGNEATADRVEGLAGAALLATNLVRAGGRWIATKAAGAGAAAPETEAAIRATEAGNLPATPAQLNPSQTLQGVDLALSRAPGARGVYAGIAQQQAEQFPDVLRDAVRRTFPEGAPVTSLQEAGTELKGMVRPIKYAAARAGGQLFDEARDVATQARASVPPSTGAAQYAAETLQDLKDGGLQTAQPSQLEKVLREVIDRSAPTIQATGVPGAPHVEIPPTPITYAELDDWRRDLNKLLPAYQNRGFETNFADSALGRLHGAIRADMETAVQDTPAEPLLSKARQFWASDVAPVRYVAKMLSGDRVAPVDAIEGLVAQRDPTKLAKFFSYMPPPHADTLKAAWWEKQIADAARNTVGDSNPGYVLRQFNKLQPGTQATLTNGQRSAVSDLLQFYQQRARVGSTTRSSMTTEGALMALGAGSMAWELAHGRVKRAMEMGLLAAAPWVTARLLTKPGVATALATGMREAPESRASLRIGAQILGNLAAIKGEQYLAPSTPPTPQP